MWHGFRIAVTAGDPVGESSASGEVKNRTLADLSRSPDEKVDALARVLKGLPAQVELAEAFKITTACRTGMSPRCWARHGGCGSRS